jgi:hypothetical protein
MILVVYGLFFVVVGFVLSLKNRRTFIETSWVRALPFSAIREARPGPQLKIEGRVVPSEQGVFVSPCTGREVVWTRVRMERWEREARAWILVTQIERGREFFVEDATGARARVRPRGAFVVIDASTNAQSISFQSSPYIDAFCASERIDPKALHSDGGQLRYTEEVILASAQVCVAGAAHRLPAMPTAEGYRDSAGTTEIVLRATDDSLAVVAGADADLFVTNVDDITARKRSRRQSIVAAGFVIGGVVAMACGAYLQFVAAGFD